MASILLTGAPVLAGCPLQNLTVLMFKRIRHAWVQLLVSGIKKINVLVVVLEQKVRILKKSQVHKSHVVKIG